MSSPTTMPEADHPMTYYEMEDLFAPPPLHQPGYDDLGWDDILLCPGTPPSQKIVEAIPDTPPRRKRTRPLKVLIPTRLVFEDEVVVEETDYEQEEAKAREKVLLEEEDLRIRLRRRKRDDYEYQQLETFQRERRFDEYLQDLQRKSSSWADLGNSKSLPIVLV